MSTSGFDWAALSSIATCAPTNAESVAGSTVQLGERAEAERILQRARLDPASFEQRTQANQCGLQSGVGTNLADARMQDTRVGAERLEIERSGAIERIEEHECVGERERTVGGRERGLVEQSDRLSSRELEVTEDPVGEIGHLREIAHARSTRAPAPHGRRSSLSASTTRWARAGRATVRRGRERVGESERRRPDDLVGNRRALRNDVLTDEKAIVAGRVGDEGLAAADAGRHPVGLPSAFDHAIGHARAPAPCARGRRVRSRRAPDAGRRPARRRA